MLSGTSTYLKDVLHPYEVLGVIFDENRTISAGKTDVDADVDADAAAAAELSNFH